MEISQKFTEENAFG